VIANQNSQLAARFAELGEIADPRLREALLREAYADRDPTVREAAIAWSARLLEPEMLVPLVAEAADATVRNAALAALERQGPYAAECLSRLVTDPDADTAMFACQALGQIGSVIDEDSLLPVLQRPEPNLVHAAAEALGRIGSQHSVPALVALLDRDPWLQLPAIAALGMIGHPSAAPALMALVPDSFVAGPALEALARIGAPTSVGRLLDLLLDPQHAELRPTLLAAVGASLDRVDTWPDFSPLRDAVAEPGDPLGIRQFLIDQLDQGDPEIRAPGDDRAAQRSGTTLTRAAGTLVLAADLPDLVSLVVRWAAEPDGRRWVLPAVVYCPDAVADALGTLLADEDPCIRAGAVRIAPPEALGREGLLAALGDASSLVRTAACDALATLEDPETAEALAGHLTSADPAERAAAARALARLPGAVLVPLLAGALAAPEDEMLQAGALEVLALQPLEEMAEVVLKFAMAGEGMLRRAALRAVARYPGSKPEVLLLRALADRDPILQTDALDLLVTRGGGRLSTTLMALLGAGDSLRYHVIRALGRLRVPAAAAPLEVLFGLAPMHEQIEIVVALGRIASDASRAFLLRCLDHQELEIRRVAARGLMEMARPEDFELFLVLAEDPDWVLRNQAAEVLGRIRRPEGRRTLLNLARDLEPAVARTARASLAVRA
jgi:HEAT repeat protein